MDSSYISLPSSYLYLCIYQYLITTPSSYYARQLVVTWKLVLVYVLTLLKIYYCPHNEIFFSAITLTYNQGHFLFSESVKGVCSPDR
jgi:hypothetical protein